MQYEPDVAVMLNRGANENEIVMGVEKNRMGEANRNLRYALIGRNFVFQSSHMSPKNFWDSYCKSIKKVL